MEQIKNLFHFLLLCGIIDMVILMNVIICLDDNKGMLFNNRRQSRDKVVISDIFADLQGEKLCITPFSEKLMAEHLQSVVACEDVTSLGNGQWFFCENLDLKPLSDKIERLIVYKWNRVYPSDMKCELDFSLFSLEGECELQGNSHPVITKQIFVRG